MNRSTPRAMCPRILGGLTAAYGAHTLARPDSLLRASGLVADDGRSSCSRTNLARAIGARDVLSGVSMITAPPGTPLRLALVARVACDLGDAIGFGLAVPRASRLKVVVVAAGWGLLCASALPAADSSAPVSAGSSAQGASRPTVSVA